MTKIVPELGAREGGSQTATTGSQLDWANFHHCREAQASFNDVDWTAIVGLGRLRLLSDLSASTVEQFQDHRLAASDPALERRGFRLLSLLGEGQCGAVLAAWADGREEIRALKGIPTATNLSLPDGRTKLARLESEAELLGSLHHPSVVSCAGLLQGTRGVYLDLQPIVALDIVDGVWRLVPGHDFADEIRLQHAAAPILRSEVLPLLHQFERICDAVQYLHRSGIVHRDLKPRNIMVDALGQPLLIDFGIASRIGAPPVGEGIAGSVRYIAPEQIFKPGTFTDEVAEVYSLGAILYQVLSGRAPFHAHKGNLSSLLYKTAATDPEPIPALNPSVPGELVAICAKAMARDRSQRYQGAGELGEAIRDYLDSRPFFNFGQVA